MKTAVLDSGVLKGPITLSKRDDLGALPQGSHVVARGVFLPALVEHLDDLPLQLLVERQQLRRELLRQLDHVKTEARLHARRQVPRLLQRGGGRNELGRPLAPAEIADVP